MNLKWKIRLGKFILRVLIDKVKKWENYEDRKIYSKLSNKH